MNPFEKFHFNRKSLIDMYNKGDLTKEEFIEQNHACIIWLNIKPFKKIDNLKKGIYNYQYYNAMAKYYQKRAHDLPKSHAGKSDFFDLAEYYYSKKDDSTFRLLKHLDYQNMEAYYVKSSSPTLSNKLFEIVIHDDEDIILHSVNQGILNALKYENVFSDETRKSLIDTYINRRY